MYSSQTTFSTLLLFQVLPLFGTITFSNFCIFVSVLLINLYTFSSFFVSVEMVQYYRCHSCELKRPFKNRTSKYQF